MKKLDIPASCRHDGFDTVDGSQGAANQKRDVTEVRHIHDNGQSLAHSLGIDIFHGISIVLAFRIGGIRPSFLIKPRPSLFTRPLFILAF